MGVAVSSAGRGRGSGGNGTPRDWPRGVGANWRNQPRKSCVVPGRAASRDAGRGGCCACAWTVAATDTSNDRENVVIYEPEIDWHDPDVMSETDWEGTGCPAGEPNKILFTAADKVAALLMPDGGPLWPKLLWIARDLIENSRDIVGDDDLTVSRWISEVATANSGAAELTAG
jgi:hypothetical protein